MWLSPVLLLLCLSGSLSLTGPSSVTGTLGGSLSVQCQYEEVYQRYSKYWCRGQYGATCEKIVETKGEEKEERSGRVSIRDHADNLTFIVTMENLTADDAGSYWCRIQTLWLLDVWSRDPSFHVNVFVSTGSLSLMGPSSVTGTLGSSLCVQCRYEEVYQRYNKYWCRGQYDTTCEKIVETKGEEKEERSGRVSIRDHADHLTFIVTMENLTADDAGSYWCRIQTVWLLDVWSHDPSFHVNVFVSTAPSKTTGRTTCQAVPAAFPGLNTKQNLSTEELLTCCSGSLLSSVHFLLLVFLKLPLFLTLVGAVLWVNRPLRGCGGIKPKEDNPQCSAPSPGRPCPGT
ncbi:CMRF35-like molecule 2 [Mustela nigripes]|uniref:CMRF35-like molecule 2 isoform X2 n=1 Tax=Mustela putorius furo TaxID=9669 RepID=A0A8U0MNG5_MUSPF|nr:CMRF35-like molecule 2 isoform X2 [Mustela putorius furo]XP_059237110.1 CMRF35-like molecule 2 [Mustela nigripes]